MLSPAMILRPIAEAPLALGTVGDEVGDRFATPRMTPPRRLPPRRAGARAGPSLDGRLVGTVWPSRGARPRTGCRADQDPIADDRKSGKRTVDSATDRVPLPLPRKGRHWHMTSPRRAGLAGGFGG